MTPFQFYISVVMMPAMTILAVFVGVLLNNSRLNDINNRLTEMSRNFENRLSDMSRQFEARLNDLRDMLRAEMAKNHSELLGKIAELETRMDRIERGR